MIFSRIQRLFDRYASRHLDVRGTGFILHDGRGGSIGHVDLIRLAGNRLRLEGWTTAARVVLAAGAAQAAARPGLHRQDVAAALGIDPAVGFEMDIAQPQGPARLILHHQGREIVHEVPPVPARLIRRARSRLMPAFARAVLEALPDALRWRLTRAPVYRARIKTALGLDLLPVASPMEVHLFREPQDSVGFPADQRITIILPVYNAFHLLPEVLDRVDRHTTLPWHLLLIEDGSTDDAVRPFLQGWAGVRTDRVTLIENPANLGFIGSVNRGLEQALAFGDPVVLLNSDAFVPAGWAERLIRPMLEHENVASVTPMSNDAEIFSVPAICTRTVLEPGQGDAIDAVAQTFHPEATLSVVPTGVGFCMAMSPAFLRRVPRLDTAFGRGYGEEVDWCQKVRALGGRHLGLPGLFVEHRGGTSFGSDDKLRLVQANNAIIAQRYPRYDADVQKFIAADPLVTARMALALAFVASRAQGPVPIYLAHVLGGGAEKDLERRIAAGVDAGGAAVVLRVGGPQRWRLDLHSPAGCVTGTTDSFDFIQRLLAPLQNRRIIYSCGVGDPDPVHLPACLLALKRGAQDRIEVLFHDFFPVTPSYCLLDSDGVYRGPVTAGRADSAHENLRPDGQLVPLVDWQAAWGALIAAADEVEVFSQDSRAHVLAAYPAAADRVMVCPHGLLAEVPCLQPRPLPDGPRTVIAVLGNIGFQKGAAVLVALARALESDPGRALVLIGNIDPAYPLPSAVRVHGDYHPSDIPGLAARYGVTCWLIPSIWPETFSFTTHEVLATGLPVFCFAIGAQGEAVARAPNGRVIRLAPGSDPVRDVLDAVAEGLPPLSETRP